MTENLPTLVRRALLTEATARKPGNVFPGADFPDLTYDHFVQAADLAAATLPAAADAGVGEAVLRCVRSTVAACGTNVNLGSALLLAPLCAVPKGVPLADGVPGVLAATTVEDAAAIFEAVRLADPGGLGDAPEQDVRGEPTVTALEAMQLAAGRDDVAREWATDFAGTADRAFALGRHWAGEGPHRWEDAVLHSYLGDLRLRPDTHVARRCGEEEAERVRRHVRTVWGRFRSPVAEQPWVRSLDGFLRGGDPRRNPGTTADLTAATLFWAAREGMLDLPTEKALAARAAAVRSVRLH